MGFSYPFCRFKSVHYGHINIHYHNIWKVFFVERFYFSNKLTSIRCFKRHYKVGNVISYQISQGLSKPSMIVNKSNVCCLYHNLDALRISSFKNSNKGREALAKPLVAHNRPITSTDRSLAPLASFTSE